MLYSIKSATLIGIDARPVDVEVDVSIGLPGFLIVGLPDAAIKESRERVRTAVKNCGYDLPPRKVLINLAPADLKKEGSGFDLALALGLLCDLGLFPQQRLSEYVILGELALNGCIKPVKGALSASVLARMLGLKGIILPEKNAEEAALVRRIMVFGMKSLTDVVRFMKEPGAFTPKKAPSSFFRNDLEYTFDFDEIKGQAHAKRAMEVAAAGGHNVLMTGPPGAGKTMLARRMPSILPPLAYEEMLDVTRIYSAAGLLHNGIRKGERPFRSPHHTITHAGMIGGGAVPKPGEVTLAHSGVLFLDELTEFRREILEDLRQPLEDEQVTVSRAAMRITFPARFMLIAAMNPFEETYSGLGEYEGTAASRRRGRFYSRISRPLLDRIDIHIDVPKLPVSDIISKGNDSSSEEIRNRVISARKIQMERFRGCRLRINQGMTPRQVRKYCPLDKESRGLLENAVNKLGFSMRGWTRALKVARTIADLEGEETVGAVQISEAIQYRIMDCFY